MTANQKKKLVGQTSPGTLYFFITIPSSQSITQTDSPPQVATRRLPPVGKKKINTIPSARTPLDVLLVRGAVPAEPCSGWKAQAHSWVEKSSALSFLLWHCRTWSGFS